MFFIFAPYQYMFWLYILNSICCINYCIVFLQSIGSYHWWWWWRSDKRGYKTSCSGIYCALWNRWGKSVYKKKERRKIKERGILAIIICDWLRYLIYKSHLCNPLYCTLNKNYISNHYDINSQTELCKIGLVVRSQVLHVRFALFNSLFDCMDLSFWCNLSTKPGLFNDCKLFKFVYSLAWFNKLSLLSIFCFLFVGMFCFGNQNSIGMRGWDNGSEGRWRIKNIFSPYPAEVDSQKMMSSLNLEMIQYTVYV